jgi:3-deoxy-D-manno-octulosonic-acid transferase
MPLRLRLFLILYRLAWYPALPVVLAYFWLRGRRDPAYRQHWAERFGAGPMLDGAVLVHAVSLGELRSAQPLIRALLNRGHRVVTTHLTPAGRRASETAFASDIAAGRLIARYLPLELGPFWRRLLRRGRPRLILSMEIEIWPVMIAEARRAGIPLFLANSQLPEKSFARETRLARHFGHPVQIVTGVLAKSDRHADRFRALGAPNVQVCGELRFDQPIPPAHLAAADRLRASPTGEALAARGVVALASVVEGEDAQYLSAYRTVQSHFRAQGRPAPLFLHIPRAPERFGTAGEELAAAGQTVLRRSAIFDASLALTGTGLDTADILLGDSMGEMYFYLSLADIVVVGGGFVPKGAHNVIEPLALRRPVLVGPHVWTIEYPGEEAREAGVMTVCPTIDDLAARLVDVFDNRDTLAAMAARTQPFFDAHAGATARSLTALDPWI